MYHQYFYIRSIMDFPAFISRYLIINHILIEVYNSIFLFKGYTLNRNYQIWVGRVKMNRDEKLELVHKIFYSKTHKNLWFELLCAEAKRTFNYFRNWLGLW